MVAPAAEAPAANAPAARTRVCVTGAASTPDTRQRAMADWRWDAQEWRTEVGGFWRTLRDGSEIGTEVGGFWGTLRDGSEIAGRRREIWLVARPVGSPWRRRNAPRVEIAQADGPPSGGPKKYLLNTVKTIWSGPSSPSSPSSLARLATWRFTSFFLLFFLPLLPPLLPLPLHLSVPHLPPHLPQHPPQDRDFLPVQRRPLQYPPQGPRDQHRLVPAHVRPEFHGLHPFAHQRLDLA